MNLIDERLKHGRRLALERLEPRIVLSAQAWNLAADFAADFVGDLPQNNPNGVWTYLGTDGTAGSLVATNGLPAPPGPDTFGVGSGWADASGVPSYARGGAFGFPTDVMAGHGRNKIVWTAPAEADLGGVELTGMLTQAAFEPARQMRLQITKNNSVATQVLLVDADFANQTAIVPLPTTQIAIEPGDTLTIVVDGNGPLGNGIATFAAWNVNIQEIDPEIDADFSGNLKVGGEDLGMWESGFGIAAGANLQNGDADGDGAVSGSDFLMWQRQVGNEIRSGEDPPNWQPPGFYHPAAIVVETTGVTLPDGTQLDIAGTQTQGLQEAFNHSAAQGWDVFVLPGIYSLDAHLDIEELQLRSFRMEDVTLNFSANVTDFGIRFDSTMMVDWYWNGGAINAPSATHGVLFQPRTPHPLDGPKFGTIGMVDSRLQFVVDITAGANAVTMDISQASIVYNTFHFQNVPGGSVNHVGGGFSASNIIAVGRTDDPIPYNLFSTAGRVTVIPPPTDISVGDPAIVYKPDGSTLSVVGTQTSGLQEAFNYASANNLDVVVFGRGIRNVAPTTGLSLYSLNGQLSIPDLVNRMVKIYAVTFNHTVVAGTAMTMSDVVDSDFEFTGQLVAVQSDVGLLIRPDSTGITNSTIRVQTTVGSPDPNDTLVILDSSLQTIEQTEFYFHEVNTSFFGIKVKNPSASTFFQDNFIRSVHNHAHHHIGLQLGEGQTNSDRIHTNDIEIRSDTDGFSSEAVVQVWGDFNTIDLASYGGGESFGAKFEPGSNDNVLTFGPISATTPIADFGTNNTAIPALSAAGASTFPSGLLGLPTLSSVQYEAFSTQPARVGVQQETEEQVDAPIALPTETRDEQQTSELHIKDNVDQVPRDAVFADFGLESDDLEILYASSNEDR